MDWIDLVERAHQILATNLFDVAGTPVTLATLITFLLIVLVTFVVSRLLQRGLDRVFHRRGLTDMGNLGAGKRLLHYAIVLIGLGVALETIGIDLKAFFAAGAIFAVAIGFAMQTIAQNFVSGVILLVEGVIKPGDILELNGRITKVQTMGIRTTIVRTLDDEDIIVPNSQLVQNAITNYTLGDNLFRVRASVGVVYSADMKVVRDTLERTAHAATWRSATRAPVVLLREFGDNSVNWEVSVWIDDPWRNQRRLNELLEAIWWAFQDAGITIAFPQLDVHFDPTVDQSLRALCAPRAAQG